MEPTEVSRVCLHCKVHKPAEAFTRHPTGKNGLQSRCRECYRIMGQRRTKERGPEMAARARERRADPDIRERDRLSSLAWKERNPDQVRAYTARGESDKRRAYRLSPAGREERRLNEQRRRANKQGSLTKAEWLGVLDDFQHRCGYCLAEGSMEIEHVQPLSKGGQHDISNIVPACPSCNRRKSDRTLLFFLMKG